MTDESRLAAIERALLRAGAEEAPRAEAREATARVLGLASTTGLVAAASHSLVRRILPTTFSGKILLSAAALALAGLAYHSHRGLPVAAPGPNGPPAVVVAAEAAPTSAPTSPAAPADAVSAPSTPADDRASKAHSPASSAQRMVSDAVRRQVALLERARSLAASSDYSGALRALDEYNRRFPDGLFGEESSLLRIDIAWARSDRAGAAALATRFLSEHPRSVHADRVRAIAEPKSAAQ